VFRRMNRVTESFLGRSVTFAGAIPADAAVAAGVRYRLPFTLLAPDARATRALEAVARRTADLNGELSESAAKGGFFHRMVNWLGGAKSAEKAAGLS